MPVHTIGDARDGFIPSGKNKSLKRLPDPSLADTQGLSPSTIADPGAAPKVHDRVGRKKSYLRSNRLSGSRDDSAAASLQNVRVSKSFDKAKASRSLKSVPVRGRPAEGVVRQSSALVPEPSSLIGATKSVELPEDSGSSRSIGRKRKKTLHRAESLSIPFINLESPAVDLSAPVSLPSENVQGPLNPSNLPEILSEPLRVDAPSGSHLPLDIPSVFNAGPSSADSPICSYAYGGPPPPHAVIAAVPHSRTMEETHLSPQETANWLTIHSGGDGPDHSDDDAPNDSRNPTLLVDDETPLISPLESQYRPPLPMNPPIWAKVFGRV